MDMEKTMTERRRRERANRGFTLIEMMIVVIIIAALAGMVVPRLIGRSEDAKKKIARADVATLSTALNLFRLDNERYPSNAEGLDALLRKPANSGATGEPYIEKRAIDPWKRPYRYEAPGSRSTGAFDVFSAGPDGNDRTEDDVGNWQ